MEERSMRKKPVVLMILDGYGLNDKVEGNAVAQANTPVMDSLMKEYPFVHGNASGMAVGLPEGQRVERYDRCEHPSGPHPMHTPCGWFAAKTQGAI
jgi:hypothetical protein